MPLPVDGHVVAVPQLEAQPPRRQTEGDMQIVGPVQRFGPTTEVQLRSAPTPVPAGFTPFTAPSQLHRPAEQIVRGPLPHRIAHAPQLLTSALVFNSHPFAASPSQSA